MFRCLKLCAAAILIFASSASHAQSQIESVTLEGGPIGTKHIQAGDEHFRDGHQLGVLKVHTQDYGNYGLYLLTPNSVDRTSVGFGYVTDQYAVPVGPFKLELSGGIGLVTGYQDYPVPLLEAEVRLVLFEKDGWDAGLAMAALPYIAHDHRDDGKADGNDFGVVVTTPFLSVRRSF